jgi:hypothetical protein
MVQVRYCAHVMYSAYGCVAACVDGLRAPCNRASLGFLLCSSARASSDQLTRLQFS